MQIVLFAEQIIDLIDKKSGKKLQRIDDAAMPVFWNVLWAPDSNGFALKTKVVGHPRLQGVDVYFRSGETFQKIELPDLPEGNIETGVVWAPDSKRFAFNYMVYSPKTDYQTVAFYQLRDGKWVALYSPAGEESKQSQLAKQEKQMEALALGLQKVSAQLEVNRPRPQVVVNDP